MLFPSWLRALKATSQPKAARSARRRPPAARRTTRRPSLEALEDRTLLSLTLNVGNLAVSGSNGAQVSNTGTFTDTTAGATVTLTASAGTVAQSSNGTWSWSETTPSGAAQTAPVTIYATDNNGQTAAADFWLNVGQVFLVTNTGDNGGGNPAPGAGTGTLRQAIVDANNASTTGGPSLIAFAIPTTDLGYQGGQFMIQPLTDLPVVNQPVVIDGYSQPGSSPNTLTVGDNAVIPITLDGSLDRFGQGEPLLEGWSGLIIGGNNSTVRGLTIQNFGFVGLYVVGVRDIDNDKVEGNAIVRTNNNPNVVGVWFAAPFDEGHNPVLGGTDPAARNIISGWFLGDVLNFCDTIVEGNYIGTNAAGTAAFNAPNSAQIQTGFEQQAAEGGGVLSGWTVDPTQQQLLIGGQGFGILGGTIGVPGAGNLISGITAPDAILNPGPVQGNLIGTDASGTRPLGNVNGIVEMSNQGSSPMIIGGSSPGAGNTIAFNSGAGVLVRTVLGTNWTTGNSVEGNSIYANGGLGIDLGGSGTPVLNDSQGHSGPNDFQNFPVLTSASSSATGTTITGTFNSVPGDTFRLDFYSNTSPGNLGPDGNNYGQGQTYLGSAQVTTDASGNPLSSPDGSAVINSDGSFTVSLPTPVLQTQGYLTATATNLTHTIDPNTNTDTYGDTSEFSPAFVVPAGNLAPITGNLQALINNVTPAGTAKTVIFQAQDSSTADTILNAVNGLAAQSTPVNVVLNLGTGTYTDVNASPPAGVTLVIAGNGSTTTIVGHSPALTVGAGNVVVTGVTLTTATDAPTVLVSGGNLTLRNDIVQESTGFADAAIAITGGTVDLGTAADPGGNTINVSGAGEFVHNTTANPISAGGDTFTINGTPQPAPTLSFTSIAASPATALLNQPVTLTATVRADGAGTPSGSVDFYDTTTQTDLGSVALSGGTASLPPMVLTAGNHVIQARYSGDGTFLPSLDTTTVSVQYNFSGFLAPLNSNLAIGSNRTVPIKFQLTDYNGAAISSPSAVTSLQVLNAQCVNVLTNAGSTALRYDPQSNQWVANWQTKGLPAGAYTVVLSLADGTTHTQTVQVTTSKGASGLTTDATGGTGSAPGGLLGGDIELYVDNSNGDLTPDELARIQDAVTAVDAVTEPYGVAVQEITDPTQADVTLNMDTTSAVGGYADGVLGCTTDAGQITIISGWNYYAGSDPTQIAAGQYDFQTVVTHELGHALGLGHSTDSTSVMYATLNAGTVNRSLTTADLNVPDSDTTGACGLHAAVGSVDATPAMVPPTAAAPMAASPPGNLLGSESAANLRAAVLPAAGAPAPLTTASLASALASAPASGNLPTFNAAASAAPQAASLLPSWNQSGLGYGAFDSVVSQWATGKAAGASPQTVPMEDRVSLPMTSPGPDAEEGAPLDKAAVPAEVPVVPVAQGELSDAALCAFVGLGQSWDSGPLGGESAGLAAAQALGDNKAEQGLAGGQSILLALLGACWSAWAGEPDSRKRARYRLG
jgi:hypothetical protein